MGFLERLRYGAKAEQAIIKTARENEGHMIREEIIICNPRTKKEIKVSAIVDTGATSACFDKSIMEKLGLEDINGSDGIKRHAVVAGNKIVDILAAEVIIRIRGRELITQAAFMGMDTNLIGLTELKAGRFNVDVDNMCIISF